MATPTAPASMPAATDKADIQQFENKKDGIAFSYPAGWTAFNPQPTQFKFDNDTVHLTFDYPDLPWHPFGTLTIDRVRSGYIDDFKKKQITSAAEMDLPDTIIPDATQHRVKLTGKKNGLTLINEAVLIVHNDSVYILSIDCDEASYPTAKSALDLAVSTLKWIK